MRLETSLLDKFVNASLLGKRQIGRPLKHNIRHGGKRGMVEMIFSPRSAWEMYLSKVMRTLHPYLAYFTYQFHVEKAREGGFRVEDIYANKFFKEPYIQNHIYAQYFHPHTLLERVRDVIFYRRPRTLFKGFTVPDWAQSQTGPGGFDYDMHSRCAWDNAMQDFRAEWTPVQFEGDRLGPNPLQALRFENVGGGMSAKLFYNEVPTPRWVRQGGHIDNRDKQLYSFKWANQDQEFIFGIDTTTPEGRSEFEYEWNKQSEMTPELFKKDEIIFPHEMRKYVSNEPHFQRVWQHYREFQFEVRLAQLVEEGYVSDEDVNAAKDFMNSAGSPSISLYILAKRGHLDSYKNDAGFLALERIFEKLNLDAIEIYGNTAQPYEEQFWEQYDAVFDITEERLVKDLPYFITDPRNRAKVEALIEGRTGHLETESTSKLV